MAMLGSLNGNRWVKFLEGENKLSSLAMVNVYPRYHIILHKSLYKAVLQSLCVMLGVGYRCEYYILLTCVLRTCFSTQLS